MNFIDLFAGAGFIRRGMERAGHKCVGFVEWDKFARKSYEAIHGKGEWTAHDITAVADDDIRSLGRQHEIHIITGGFPCQAFSVAGKRGGFKDTRGTLFFEIARFASIIRPKYLLLENVEGLLNHDKGNTFETILSTLDELGYDAEWQLCNSKDFGVPQNRERVFIVCFNRDFGTESRPQVFPIAKDVEIFKGIPRGGAGQERQIVNCIDSNYGKGPDRHGARTIVYHYHSKDCSFRKFNGYSPTLAQYMGTGGE